MNDADHQKLRDAGWRRPLSPEEEARLRAWLDAHPDERVDWDAELELTRLLAQLPEAPLSSNFTARVMRAAARGDSPSHRPIRLWRLRPRWLRLWAPGSAIATLVAALAITTIWSHHLERKAMELTRVANAASGMEIIGAMSVLPREAFEDFDAIHQLTFMPQPQASVDLELLAALQ